MADIDKRQLVLDAITFNHPARIPNTYTAVGGALLKYGQAMVDVCRRFPNDFYDADVVKVPEPDTANYKPDGSYCKRYTDEWGCVWVAYQEGISGEVKESPLADWSDLPNLRVPAVTGASPKERAEAKERMSKMKETHVGWGGGGILYERMQFLRGHENMMMDIAYDREEVYQLADRIVDEYLIPTIELSLESGADIIGFGDDWGAQQQLLINPISWRKIFGPRYKKMFDLVHEGGALAWMHSDGQTMEIIPDWIEIGLDVLNPQIVMMDWHALREATAGRLCLAPDVERQGCMAFGTPHEVREHIRAIRDTFGDPAGGLIFTGPIEAGVPLENAEALLQAFHDFQYLGDEGE